MTTQTFGSDLSAISERVKPLEKVDQIELIVNKILEKAKEAASKGERCARYILAEDKLSDRFLYHESKEVLIIFQQEDVIVKFEHRLYCNNSCECDLGEKCSCKLCDFNDSGEHCSAHPGYVIDWI